MSNRAKSRLGNIKTLADKKPPRDDPDGPGGRKVAPPSGKAAGDTTPRLPSPVGRSQASDGARPEARSDTPESTGAGADRPESISEPSSTTAPSGTAAAPAPSRPPAATPAPSGTAAAPAPSGAGVATASNGAPSRTTPPAPSTEAVRATDRLARQRQEAASARKSMKGFRVARQTAEEFADAVGEGSQSREIRLAIKNHLSAVIDDLATAEAPELFADFEPVLESQRRAADEVRLTVYLTRTEAQALDQMTASVPDRSVAKVLEEAVIRRTRALQAQTVHA